jgi:phage portal protein BeeE
MAASRTMATENAAIGWNRAMLDNSGVPGGMLTVPAQALQVENRKELQEEIDREFTGEKRFRPLILWGGMDWKQTALSQRDMEFLQQRRLNKYELCATFGVPAPLVGAMEDPTYSNYGVARLSFWEDTIIFLLDWLRSKINTHIAPYFGEGIYADYDLSDVPAFRDSFLQKVKTAVELVRTGWTLNQVNSRMRLGFPAVEWGDVAWLPGNLVPVGGSGVPEPAEEEPEEEEEPETPEDAEDDEDDTDDATTRKPGDDSSRFGL